MSDTVDQAKQRVKAWTAAHRQAALYDEHDATLLDVASGKRIKLSWRGLQAWEEKTHPETGGTYLVLLFDDGSQVALVEPGGVAFAPSTENSGPIENLPPVVSLRDFLHLKGQVDHYLYDHPDEAPPRECLDMIMVCIATLDGARAVGFDVGDLESALEKSLDRIEKDISSS